MIRRIEENQHNKVENRHVQTQVLQREDIRSSSLRENVGISLPPETLYTTLTALESHILAHINNLVVYDCK